MTVTPLHVIALATQLMSAARRIQHLTVEELEAAAQFQLDQRGAQCQCGMCPPATPIDKAALESSAAFLLMGVEFIQAAKHADEMAIKMLQQHGVIPRKNP